jgi:outer membrane protein TolC
VLVGEYPENMMQELSKPDLIPSMPAATAPGVPLDLLKRRPDIQQAERELAAATARIGVATANLFPQVALVGAIGSQATGLGNDAAGRSTFGRSDRAPSGRCSTSARLDAEVDIADLEAHASLLNYRKTILNAVQQVDTSVDAYAGGAGAHRTAGQRDDRRSARRGFGDRAIRPRTHRFSQCRRCRAPIVYDLQEQYAFPRHKVARRGRAVRPQLYTRPLRQ